MDAPVIGADGPSGCDPHQWQVGFSWRHQKSFRHYIGDEEQVEREQEGSQVINWINLTDISIRYNLDERWSFSASIPYLIAKRSNPIRNEDRQVVGRSISSSHGISDIVLTARRWMFDPLASSNRNVWLGLGIKIPTGSAGVVGTRRRLIDGDLVTSVQTNDQSIQPGDGGFGVLLDVMAFQMFAGGRAAVYASGSYLANPGGTNGVVTFRSRESEAIMSIADQYVARVGVSSMIPGIAALAGGLGFRAEGVPARDLLGPSDGFRRPGYAYSIEPTLSYRVGVNTLSAGVPVALYRNRTISVPDSERGGHGDAAFADWILMVGISRSM
jgi:hypothetical protein